MRLMPQILPTLCFIRPISPQRSGCGLLISGANLHSSNFSGESTLTIPSTKAS